MMIIPRRSNTFKFNRTTPIVTGEDEGSITSDTSSSLGGMLQIPATLGLQQKASSPSSSPSKPTHRIGNSFGGNYNAGVPNSPRCIRQEAKIQRLVALAKQQQQFDFYPTTSLSMTSTELQPHSDSYRTYGTEYDSPEIYQLQAQPHSLKPPRMMIRSAKVSAFTCETKEDEQLPLLVVRNAVSRSYKSKKQGNRVTRWITRMLSTQEATGSFAEAIQPNQLTPISTAATKPPKPTTSSGRLQEQEQSRYINSMKTFSFESSVSSSSGSDNDEYHYDLPAKQKNGRQFWFHHNNKRDSSGLRDQPCRRIAI